MTTTGQTKKKIKSDNDVQVPKEGGKHPSTPLKEAVVVDDQDEKQKIDGRTSTQDRSKMVDPTRQKASICSDVKDKEAEEKVNEKSKTQTSEEDPTGRQSVETKELNPTRQTLTSSSNRPKDDQFYDKIEGNFNLKNATEKKMNTLLLLTLIRRRD